jgi:tRNA-dihydrouridine synthase 4
MILAKEFNRNQMARDSDFTASTLGEQPATIVQFGANSPLEVARAASLAAPFANGVDLNCGCPQSWACAETLGAALMERRELVRDMVMATRARLRADGWRVDSSSSSGAMALADSAHGRSVSVKIRVHKDLRRTMDFITTVLGDGAGSGLVGEGGRHIDWLTIHPRTRSTPSSTPINVESLAILAEKFGRDVPILVSGDVFTLTTLPYTTSPLLQNTAPTFTATTGDDEGVNQAVGGPHARLPDIPHLRGLMSARALLANPALFAGRGVCPWEAVDVFLAKVARAPLPLKLGVHHLTEMTGPGFGPDKRALLNRRERVRLVECDSWIDVLDTLGELRRAADRGPGKE